jgi:2-C-methyl-D-erythritol 2,4-cyclodiphosphate synthase
MGGDVAGTRGGLRVSAWRVGTGFDVHRLVPGRPLRLGGIAIPFERGLLGHSDGDALLHAVCDALLGAAGAGELGTLFPSSDPRLEGAPSLAFLAEVARVLARKRLGVESLDATLIAEAPALAPHLPAMRAAIAGALGLAADRVSVKAKSTDGLGAIGRGEGIAALAVALLRPRGTAGGGRRSRAGTGRRAGARPRS